MGTAPRGSVGPVRKATRQRAFRLLVLIAGVVPLSFALPASADSGGSTGSGPSSLSAAHDAQSLSVRRADGEVTLSDVGIDGAGRLGLVLTDTRSADPGWTISVSVASVGPGEPVPLGFRSSTGVVEHTASFVDSDGSTYEQQVAATRVVQPPKTGRPSSPVLVVSAPVHHGLGIARIASAVTLPPTLRWSAVRVTVTMV